MPLYRYLCTNLECNRPVDVFHPIRELGQPRVCGGCGAPLRRKLTPVHHWWPSHHRPGLEDSGQRLFLDPEFQARQRDKLARSKEAHLKRTAKERADHDPRSE